MPSIYPEHAPMPRAFLAWDGTAYRVVSVNAAGEVQVEVGQHVTRFSDRLAGAMIDNNVAAGNITVYGTQPGAGVWWLVEQVGATNKVSVCTQINGGIDVGGTAYFVQGQASPPAWTVVNLPGPFLLTGTDRVRVAFRGCAAGDDLQIWWTGWIVDIT